MVSLNKSLVAFEIPNPLDDVMCGLDNRTSSPSCDVMCGLADGTSSPLSEAFYFSDGTLIESSSKTDNVVFG